MSLHGNLRDFSVLETLQVIGLQKKSGVLEIESGKDRCALHFTEGCVVGCAPLAPSDPDPFVRTLCGLGLCELADAQRLVQDASELAQVVADRCGLDGETLRAIRTLALHATLERALLWHRGEFRFSADVVRPGATGDSVDQILLEAMRRLDEAADWKATGCSLDAIPRLHDAGSAFMSKAEDPSDRLLERALLRHVDGRCSLRQIADLLGVSEWNILRAAQALQTADRIRISSARRPAEPQQLLLVQPRATRRGAAVVLILVLTLGCGALGLFAGQVTATFTRPRQAEAARQRRAFDDERAIRTALELYRMRAGEYPSDLMVLAESGLWPRRDRAPLRAARYAGGGLDYRLGADDPTTIQPAASASPSHTASAAKGPRESAARGSGPGEPAARSAASRVSPRSPSVSSADSVSRP